MSAAMRKPISPRASWIKAVALVVPVVAIALVPVLYQAAPHYIKPAAAQVQFASLASHELRYMPTPAEIGTFWAALR
jgi:hypothetical protein